MDCPTSCIPGPFVTARVMPMKNACSPTPQDVKISTPQWAARAAAGIGAEMVDRIAHTGVRVLGDPALPTPGSDVRPAGTLTGGLRHGGARARTVHRTSSVELVKVLGHRCPKKPRRP